MKLLFILSVLSLMLFILSVLSLMLFTTSAKAAETCNNEIRVEVNGLVCDFCARALEKVFYKQENVTDINVNLDDGLVIVGMKPDTTLEDETLTKLITDSGYNVRNILEGC